MKLMSERDHLIYREELAPRLPQRIFVAHVHVFSKDFFPAGFEFSPQSCYNKFGGDFPLTLWRELMKELLPEQEVWVNCFSSPHDLVDRDRLPEVNQKNEFVMAVVSPADSAESLAKRVESTGAVGVKPYLNFAADFYGKKETETPQGI